MVYETAGAAYRSQTFAVQLVMTMIINFGINFGLEWATMSKWGGNPDRSSWPALAMWRMNPVINSCLGMDMLITTFAQGFFCMLLATGGTQKEVRDKKCDVLSPHAIQGGWWRFTPVPIRNLCLRSFAAGLELTLVAGIPTMFLVWAGVGNGTMPGLSYTIFKGVWATATSALVYAWVFPAAIDKRNFPELEFEELMNMAAAEADRAEGPPLVANPAAI